MTKDFGLRQLRNSMSQNAGAAQFARCMISKTKISGEAEFSSEASLNHLMQPRESPNDQKQKFVN
jgi:hypothetical protein